MYSGQDGNGSIGANFSGTGVSQGPIASDNNATASGSNMIPMQPIASGGGDIVLSSGGQKSGKDLKWVIGIIVGILVFVGIGVGVWFSMMKTDVLGGESVELSFNMYANYFLYGEKKSDRVHSDQPGYGESYFRKEMVSEGSLEYMEELGKYFEDFYNAVSREDDSAFGDFLENYKNELKLVMAYYKYGTIDSNMVFELYFAGDDVIKNIEEKLAPYKEVGEINRSNYYDLAFSYGKSALMLVEKYSSMGCVIGSEVDYDCVYAKSDGEMNKIVDELSEYNLSMRLLLDKSIDNVGEDIYGLANYIYDSEDRYEGSI